MNTKTEPARRRAPRHRCLTALLLGGTALAALPMTAAAQESALQPDGTYRLSPILVDTDNVPDDDANSIVAKELWVGGKVATSVLDTPASVSVITAKEIETRNADKVEDVLEYTSGIITDFYGSDDRNDYYLVRGFQASTYRDGLTLGSMRGVREEPYAYERLEVLKGANSTLFGASDPGGSVNFVTKTPRFYRFGEVYAQGGSHGHGELGFDMGDVLDEEGTLAYRFVGKLQKAGLEYDTSRDDEAFFLGSLSWAVTPDTELTFSVDYLKRDATPNSGGYPLDRLYDRDLFFGEPEFNDHDVERLTASAALEHDFGNGLRLNANLRYSDLTDDFAYVYLTDSASRTGTVIDRDYFGTDSTAQELIGNVILQYDASFGAIDSSTLAGLEYRDATSTSASIYGDAGTIDIANPVYTGAPTVGAPYREEERDYTTTSLFVQQNLSFSDRFIATVGLRHDWMDLASRGQNSGTPFDDADDFSETSVRGALTYKVTDEISTYVSYVESVAPPAIGVAPERGEQYEVGVKYQPAGINALFTAAAYDLTKNDITVPVVLPDGSIDRQLIGETRVRGFELEGKAELTPNLSLTAAYTYTDSEVLRSAPVRGANVEGNAFATAPNHTASVWLTYLLPAAGNRGDMTFGLGARYIGPYYYNLQNNNGQSEAQTLVDAAFTYGVTDSTDFSVNVSNLFDKQYVVGRGTADYYNPGRTISATLRHTW